MTDAVWKLWPELPEAIRSGILAMVKAASGSGKFLDQGAWIFF
jgi:hypothetical protein